MTSKLETVRAREFRFQQPDAVHPGVISDGFYRVLGRAPRRERLQDGFLGVSAYDGGVTVGLLDGILSGRVAESRDAKLALRIETFRRKLELRNAEMALDIAELRQGLELCRLHVSSVRADVRQVLGFSRQSPPPACQDVGASDDSGSRSAEAASPMADFGEQRPALGAFRTLTKGLLHDMLKGSEGPLA